MGNIIGSFISGFAKIIGDLFGSPLDFLNGKYCSSICESTWDLICYIENFCIANLLKLLMVLVLSYIVLLLLYLLYKIGICDVGRSLCRMVWSCFVCFLSVWKYGCSFLCVKLRMFKRITSRDQTEMKDHKFRDDWVSYQSVRPSKRRHQSREHRRIQLERSLRAQSHRWIRVGISRGSAYRNNGSLLRHRVHHNIKVTQMSKFVHKGTSSDRRISRKKRGL